MCANFCVIYTHDHNTAPPRHGGAAFSRRAVINGVSPRCCGQFISHLREMSKCPQMSNSAWTFQVIDKLGKRCPIIVIRPTAVYILSLAEKPRHLDICPFS
jgi:hypothetical protein